MEDMDAYHIKTKAGILFEIGNLMLHQREIFISKSEQSSLAKREKRKYLHFFRNTHDNIDVEETDQSSF